MSYMPLTQVVGAVPEFIKKNRDRVLASPIASRFAKGAFWSIVGAVLSRSLALLSSILVARILGHTVFGEFGMVLSTVGTAGTFAGLGLGTASTKYMANLRISNPEKAGKILALSSLVSIGTASIVSIGLISGSSLLARQVLHAPQLASPLAIAAGLVFFSVLNGVQTGALAGFEAFLVIAKTNFIAGIFSFPFTLLGVWYWGVSGAVFGMVMSMAVNWGLNNRALRIVCRETNVPYIFHGCWSERLFLWEFAIPAALSGYLTAPIMWYANFLLVNRPQGYAEMGIFSAAQQWQAAILFLPVSLAPMVLSLMANCHGDGNSSNYWRMVKVSFGINALIAGTAAVCISLLSPVIMKAYGQSFSGGWLVLVLLAISAFIVAVTNVIGQIIASSASMWWGLCLNLLWAVEFIVLACLLVTKYGSIGLASSYLISYSLHLIVTIIYLYYAKRSVRIC
ncbi:MAG: oligosaccharide flippase family protein [Geobacteraceae bacterium]|nr:oligosaccharide flippase family protein [Geobacteraceae bacterium]